MSSLNSSHAWVFASTPTEAAVLLASLYLSGVSRDSEDLKAWWLPSSLRSTNRSSGCCHNRHHWASGHSSWKPHVQQRPWTWSIWIPVSPVFPGKCTRLFQRFELKHVCRCLTLQNLSCIKSKAKGWILTEFCHLTGQAVGFGQAEGAVTSNRWDSWLADGWSKVC